jgi:hypothetical protein
LQQAGEPPIWTDDKGKFVRCPKCGTRIAWPPAKPGTVSELHSDHANT